MMLLGVLASAIEALGEIVVPLPSGAPLIDTHYFEAVADRWVDLDRVTFLNLSPFTGVYPRFRFRIDFCVYSCCQAGIVL